LSVIKTVNLTKKYGDMYAIRSIDLDLHQGDLFGFIGPNGAGKTTTMRIIATLLAPTYGEANVCDHSIYSNPKEIRRLVGFMPDFFGVYDDMTVIEYLEFFAAAYRINGPQRRKRCDEMLEIVDLNFKRDAYANTLSRGQTQRLGLARVLIHDPQVLLLDEPLSGLDPRARIEMRNLLRRLGELGKTIIVSSHILPELADICNKVGIINRGEMGFNGPISDLIKLVRPQTVLEIQLAPGSDQPAVVGYLQASESVERVEAKADTLEITLREGVDDFSQLARGLVLAGHAFRKFSEKETNLESAFMALTRATGDKM
jgi:ABC-2 type transport system ATP-binding protein